MALIGEMRYLQIGSNTYEIPTSELPIASSSTLGGIKVGTNLSIDSSTGVLSVIGIPTISITRNLTSGTKSATINVDGTDYDIYSKSGTVTSVQVQATSPVVSSQNTAQSSTLSTTISLADNYGDTKNPYASKTKNYVLAAPSNADGAPSFRALVANDIPDLSSTYLTSYTETDPVFSASAAAGISSTDISNWNAKGSVSSVGLTNATNGGLTISGSPVTSSGSITVGHTNILTSAQTTQAVYPIKIDKNGHISAYGSAVSIPSKTSDLTNDSGFITDAGVTSFNGDTGAITYTAPVTSVNGNTGAVTISVPTASSTTPAMDGTAAVGSETTFARGDHVHPTDTSRAATSTVTTQASIGSDGLITYKNSGNTSLYTVQLPLFDGSSGASSLDFLPLGGGTITGNLTVNGTTTLGSTLGVSGKITGGNGLDITGAITTQGNLSINGTTSSTGLLTASNGISTTTLTTSGNSTVGGTLGITGNATVGGTLGVTGATTLSNTLSVTGNTTLSGNLTVNGTVSGQGFGDLLFGVGNVISSNTNCDTLLSSGKYSCQNSTVAATLTNSPFTNCGFGLFVIRVSTLTNYLEQIAISNSTSIMIKMRYYNSNTWTEWKSLIPT